MNPQLLFTIGALAAPFFLAACKGDTPPPSGDSGEDTGDTGGVGDSGDSVSTDTGTITGEVIAEGEDFAGYTNYTIGGDGAQFEDFNAAIDYFDSYTGADTASPSLKSGSIALTVTGPFQQTQQALFSDFSDLIIRVDPTLTAASTSATIDFASSAMAFGAAMVFNNSNVGIYGGPEDLEGSALLGGGLVLDGAGSGSLIELQGTSNLKTQHARLRDTDYAVSTANGSTSTFTALRTIFQEIKQKPVTAADNSPVFNFYHSWFMQSNAHGPAFDMEEGAQTVAERNVVYDWSNESGAVVNLGGDLSNESSFTFNANAIIGNRGLQILQALGLLLCGEENGENDCITWASDQVSGNLIAENTVVNDASTTSALLLLGVDNGDVGSEQTYRAIANNHFVGNMGDDNESGALPSIAYFSGAGPLDFYNNLVDGNDSFAQAVDGIIDGTTIEYNAFGDNTTQVETTINTDGNYECSPLYEGDSSGESSMITSSRIISNYYQPTGGSCTDGAGKNGVDVGAYGGDTSGAVTYQLEESLDQLSDFIFTEGSENSLVSWSFLSVPE